MAAAAKALGFEGPDAWTDALAYVSADHAPPVWKTRLFLGAGFIATKNDHFTKTGSGQTLGTGV
jgi:hypothetical protein